jgi:COMPASS component SWD3
MFTNSHTFWTSCRYTSSVSENHERYMNSLNDCNLYFLTFVFLDKISCTYFIYHNCKLQSSFVKFAPNGKFLLVSTLDSTLKLWELKTSKVVKIYKGHTNIQYCIFSTFCMSKGQWVITGSTDGKVVVYDLQKRKILQLLDDAHTGQFISTVLFTCSIYFTHRVYTFANHNEIIADSVSGVDTHPTLTMIATGSLDKDRTIKIWEHVDVEEEGEDDK